VDDNEWCEYNYRRGESLPFKPWKPTHIHREPVEGHVRPHEMTPEQVRDRVYHLLEDDEIYVDWKRDRTVVSDLLEESGCLPRCCGRFLLPDLAAGFYCYCHGCEEYNRMDWFDFCRIADVKLNDGTHLRE
jgi:hypothetical protein